MKKIIIASSVCLVVIIGVVLWWVSRDAVIKFSGEQGNEIIDSQGATITTQSTYHKGEMFYVDKGGIYRYDMKKKKRTLIVKSDANIVCLNALDKYLIAIEGTKEEESEDFRFYLVIRNHKGKVLKKMEVDFMNYFVKDDSIYYFSRQDMVYKKMSFPSLKEQVICKEAGIQVGIAGKYMYYIKTEEKDKQIYRVVMGDLDSEESKELTFLPNEINVTSEGTIYLSEEEGNLYDMTWEEEPKLVEGVSGTAYKVIKDSIYYIDGEQKLNVMKMDSGESKIVIDNAVSWYQVHEANYIVYDTYKEQEGRWLYLFNMKTKKQETLFFLEFND